MQTRSFAGDPSLKRSRRATSEITRTAAEVQRTGQSRRWLGLSALKDNVERMDSELTMQQTRFQVSVLRVAQNCS